MISKTLGDERLYTSLFLPFAALFCLAEAILIICGSTSSSIDDPVVQWQWMLIYFLLFGATSRYATTALDFYSGGSLMSASDPRTKQAFTALTLSAFITWVFAKSVVNASLLGASFGWVGGVAYACYYTSFLSAALVIMYLRRQGFESLPAVIHVKYGRWAAVAFSLAIVYRLFNEVWSNTVVVASFYGTAKSSPWWAAVVVGGFIPALYVFFGGLRASIYSDVAQALVAIMFLVIVLVQIYSAPDLKLPLVSYNPVPGRNMWSLEGGFDLVLVALLQGMFSYPFFDPVLTDRGFLSSVHVMVPSFILAGTLGAGFIFCFSLFGLYGAQAGVGGSPPVVAEHLGASTYSLVSLIMIVSSLSTLDSTFSSTAKAVSLEFATILRGEAPRTPGESKAHDLSVGRYAICAMLVLGTLPLLGDVKTLDATTVSGTVVMGLGPPVIGAIFFGPAATEPAKPTPLAFHLSFWCGVAFGATFQAKPPANVMAIGKGKYAQLLGFNLFGLIACTCLYFIGLALHRFVIDKKTEAIP